MQRGQEWVQELNELEGGASEFEFLDFANFDVGEHQQQSAQHHGQAAGLDISSPMGRLTFAQNGQMPPLTPQQQAMLHNMEMNMAANMQSNMEFNTTQQQSQHQVHDGQSHPYQQYSMFQDVQNPYRNQVPPTPVSAEMHASKYGSAMDNAGQILFERQNASFTPLSSPAIENPWGMPEYVIAAEDFFSPLTSPMLDAQLDAAYSTHTTSSPVDLANDTQQAPSKPRRKLNPTSRVASTRSLRGSPIVKANTRRKQGSVSGNVAGQTAINVEQSSLLLPGTVGSNLVSSEDSVSPEPLSESLMRPPPIPASSRVFAKHSKEDNVPATPATLMRISGKQGDSIPGVSGSVTLLNETTMEDITLPAAAAGIPQHVPLHPLDTRVADDLDDSSTPTMTAKTPKLSADSTPRSAGLRSSIGSHELLPKPTRGGRGAKKRQSISQATVSPALRPKISPSISPMVNTGEWTFIRHQYANLYSYGNANSVSRNQCIISSIQVELSEHS